MATKSSNSRGGDAELGSDEEEVMINADHDKLLHAVHLMDTQQRIKPPTRTEPSLQVSEFDLAPVKGGSVHLKDLARSLERQGKSFDEEVARKVRCLTKGSKTLRKPLEKPQAQKAKRIVGYNNLKDQVARWDAIVQTNKAARSITFPMNIESLNAENTTDVLARWQSQTPSDLEVAMNELLGRSKVAQEDKKEEEQFRLTLAELREKRQEIAKLRAQQSYQEAKARRLKKIKSKKYHRIMRKEKMHKQLKEFEALQKTDPEAALRQLEQMERVRAEERMSLRHKSTGQWARSRLIRAKYDPQTRQQLAEQLAVSRDLTKKMKAGDSSDEDDPVEVEKVQAETNKLFAEDKDNPWITVKTGSEVQEFVSGYRKYWEEKNKKLQETPREQSLEKESLKEMQSDFLNSSEHDIEEMVTVNNTEIQEDSSVQNSDQEENVLLNMEINDTQESSDDEKYEQKEANKRQTAANYAVGKTQRKKKKKRTDDVLEGNESIASEKTSRSINFHKELSLSKGKSDDIMAFKCSSEMKHTKNVKDSRRKSKSSKDSIMGTSNGWIVTPVKSTPSAETISTSDEQAKDPSCNSAVQTFLSSALTDASENEGKKKRKRKSALDRLFDEAENNMSFKIQDKIDKLKSDLAVAETINSDEVQEKLQKRADDLGALLALPNMREKRPVVDTELLEGSEMDSQGQKAITDMIDKASSGGVSASSDSAKSSMKSEDTNINPNDFIAAKPKVLLSAVPELMAAAEEALDDEMEDEQQMAISEAFADDNVVDDFRKEKEDEVNNSKLKDIDLSLPGWGSWGGTGLKESTRKKRRFIIKAPPQPTRRDASISNVIIKEQAAPAIREHQVNELPRPFNSVKEFEASIRAPVGSMWVPEIAHRKLIEPAVITKMGQIIEPMDEECLVKKVTIVDIED